MKFRFMFACVTLAMLAACGQQTATDALAAAESTDAAALAGVIAWKATGAASTTAGKAVLNKLQSDQLAFDAVAMPIETAATTGGSVPTAEQTAALNAALTVLQNDMAANNVAPAAQ
jgi:hypothetical protein